MAKAAKSIEQWKRDVDFVVEVRDARIPFASANDHLKDILGDKPKLIVLNKADLACPRETDSTIHFLKYSKGENVLHTSATAKKSASKIVGELERSIPRKFRTLESLVLVVGIPNVGKSTLINAIRNYCMRRHSRKRTSSRSAKWGRGTKTGKLPGVTRSVSQIRVSADPPIAMIDTPGMLLPRIESIEIGLRLAVTGAVRDAVVGEDVLASFLLEELCRAGHAGKVRDAIGVDIGNGPDDAIRSIAASRGRDPDDASALMSCSAELLRAFRSGELGRVSIEGKASRGE